MLSFFMQYVHFLILIPNYKLVCTQNRAQGKRIQINIFVYMEPQVIYRQLAQYVDSLLTTESERVSADEYMRTIV